MNASRRAHNLSHCSAAAVFLAASLSWATTAPAADDAPASRPAPLFEADNLVAWCIVPFDARRRSPAQRALMLKELGIRKCAYDWRDEHVPTFEEEIRQYRKHGIEMFAFWAGHEEAFRLFEKYDLHPQIWRIVASPPNASQEEKVAAATASMLDLARRTRELGCPLVLYNHGGWSGEPENLIAVCRRLRAMGYEHVGIVYNFHHGHDEIANWKASFDAMKPYLLCLNINGMNPQAEPKIVPLSHGRHEREMLQVVADSDYRGPIGILDHRGEFDARESLLENLEGLQWIRRELSQPGSGGDRPRRRLPDPGGTANPPAGGRGVVLQGQDGDRRPPITVECRATLRSRRSYNILVASDEKKSAAHWELFSMNRTGMLTAYLPGRRPDHVATDSQICDNRPHSIAMVYEPTRVRLYVDGKLAADQQVAAAGEDVVPGGLAIERLVEGGIYCDGDVEWLRILRGVRQAMATAAAPVDRDATTLLLWKKADATPPPAAQSGLPPLLPYSAALVRQLAAEAGRQGRPQPGAEVFAAAKSACLSCHRVGRHGGRVGPDLSRIGKQRQLAQLIESVFWPQRHVEPEYTAWNVITHEGRTVRGYRLQSNDDEVLIRDPADDRTIAIPAEDVDDAGPAGSLMPDGLTAAMTRQQQLDLVAFLSRLGDTQALTPSQLESAFATGHRHVAASFPYQPGPLRPEQWPHRTHPVNRHRLYDFYRKEAEYFRQARPVPHVLPEFPGLDGGGFGHWGNQDEQDWADPRWNEVQLGSLQCGVFRGGGLTVPRGVCLKLGDRGQLSACFDPDTLSYALTWSGGFVTFSSVRHGFLNGLQIEGQPMPSVAGSLPFDIKSTPRPVKYHGFYRHGKRVVFAYRVGDTEYLDAPWCEDGKFIRQVAAADEHPLRHLTGGGPPQWPQQMTTPIQRGEGRPYAVDTIELPFDNPWRAPLFCGGHDFLADGSAVICTMQGDVWKVSGFGIPADGSLPVKSVWRRIASGLHHPLGVVVDDDGVFVQCRDQLTRLHDLNDDGEADFYECFSKAFETSPAGHDFICGLQRDPAGRFYTASGNQGLLRIAADGSRCDVMARAMRNPDGLGLLPDGTLTVPCSEGNWTPASMICAVPPEPPADASATARKPLHFGYGGPPGGHAPALPLAYLPRGLDNSSGGQTYVSSDRWGPLQGQLLHFSFGMGRHFLVLRDRVNGHWQGAVVPLPGDFRSGVHRGRFHPGDGQLYVTGMDGWVSFTPDDGCFQRVRYTGDPVQLPVGFRVHQNGVMVTFSEPLDRGIAEHPGNHFAQGWNYRYSAAYGSAEFATSHPGVRGHDPLTIRSAHVLPDGHRLFIELPNLQPINQLHLRLHVDQEPSHSSGHDLFVTVHALGEPFADFPGYEPRRKTVAPHPIQADLAWATKRVPNPWRQPIDGARAIVIATDSNLRFATQVVRASPGEAIKLTLRNPDVVPHNWALVRRDAMQRVGRAANRLIADPDAVAFHYVPRTDDVLVYTDIVAPGEDFSVYFRAPQTPGRYPYLCTFPGHWMVMNGELIVEASE